MPMSVDSNGHAAEDAELVELHALVTRVVRARVRNPDTADDLVQETVARVLAVRGRLDDGALAPYAVVTARNLVRSSGRQEDRRRRHSHRLFDGDTAPSPEDELTQEEERTALGVAWSKLGPDERRALAAHEIDGAEVAALAQESDATPGAVAVRLSRSRARLRLEYVLALRRVELPSDRCRSVLLAISSRDHRRQVALDAGEHLLHCECCASLSEPLLKRSRPLAVLWPLVAVLRVARGMGAGASRAGRWLRGHPVRAAGGATGFAVAAVAVVVLTRPDDGWLRSDGRSLLPPPAAAVLAGAVGHPVEARSVRVQSVATPTGFWVGTSERSRLFVEVPAPPAFTVGVGQKVSFVGRIDANHAGTVEQFTRGGPDADQLRTEGHHVDVEAKDCDEADVGVLGLGPGPDRATCS